MRNVTVAVTQFAPGWDLPANLDRAEALVRRAAGEGAQVILLQELFATPYFCITEEPRHLALAAPMEGHPVVARFAALARELGVVLPVSVFERAGEAHFNSVAMVDRDGSILGTYRKSHIPQGPGYEEKFYFTRGDTGFRVGDTAFGRRGVAIWWEQWVPEAAGVRAVQGGEGLLDPTAIGSEPPAPDYDSQPHWETVMRGHAAANILPVAASNRIGREVQQGREVTFYGTSFVADQTGGIVTQADRVSEDVRLASFDLDAIRDLRRSWGLFRDRRPELYGSLGGFG